MPSAERAAPEIAVVEDPAGAQPAVAEEVSPPRLPVEPQRVPAAKTTGTIEGRVVGTGGRLLRQANVTALRPSEDDSSVPLGVPADVGEDGRFALRDLVPDTYMLLARVTGVGYHREEGVEVRAGEVTPVEIVVPLGCFVAGSVVDRHGNRVRSNLSFHRVREEGAPGSDPLRTQPTREDGTFLAGSLKPGRYSLFVRPFDGREGAELHDLVLVEGSGMEGLSVVLPSGLSVSGWVRDASGAPVVGAKVEVRKDPRFRGEGARSQNLRGETDSAGAFRVEGMHDQAASILVTAEGIATVEVVGIEPGAEGLEIVLPPPTGFAGRVVDDASGAAIRKFTIRTTWWEVRSGGSRGDTGPDGSFESDSGSFELLGLREGKHEVRTTAEGYSLSSPVDVLVRRGEIRPGVEIRMQRGGTIRGIVRDAASGEPVEGASVRALRVRTGDFGRLEYPEGRNATSDAEGRFELQDISPGKVRVRARKGGHAEGTTEAMDIVSGQTIGDVAVTLPLGGAVEGLAIGASGQPLHPASAEVAPTELLADMFRPGMTQTSPDGSFRIEKLAPGRHRVTVRPGPSLSEEPLVAMVEVIDGQTTRVEFDTKPKGCVVRGRVLRDGVGVPGVEVEVHPRRGGDRPRTHAGPDGRYVVKGVPPGPAWIQASTSGGPQRSVAVLPMEVPAASEYQQDILFPAGRIQGRVTRASDGSPVAGASLWASPSGRTRQPGRPGPSAQAETDEDGRYELRDLPDGEYRVAVDSRRGGRIGKTELADYLVPKSREPVFLQASESEEVDISLEEGGTLVVTVRSEDGSPVREASVWLRSEEGSTSGQTDSDGVARLSGVPPGEHVVTVGHRDFVQSQSEPCEVKPGRVEPVLVVLQAGVEVIVRLRTEEDVRLDRPSIQFLDAANRRWSALPSPFRSWDSEAPFVVRLLPGTYSMRVAVPGFREVERSVEVGAVAPPAIEVRLEKQTR